MKLIILSSCILLFACNDNDRKTQQKNVDTTEKPSINKKTNNEVPNNSPTSFSNERFRKVTVEKIAADSFLIRGEAQIFEANFGWVVEDGHIELKNGHQMTDAGAPEWGKFEFKINVEKERENSTLNLILFESSAMDGSRVHQLVIGL